MNPIDVAMAEFERLVSDRILVRLDAPRPHVWLYRCGNGSVLALETPRQSRPRKCAKVWSSVRPSFPDTTAQFYPAGKARLHSLKNTPLSVTSDAWALRFDEDTSEIADFLRHVRSTGAA